ncbi:MAG: hypothetical protein J3K34DRAFT_209112 [Monoraphidium minutum]|nr:MAG: hypothetical protein J3K34DRAFT_209112 [Monoraphidium minutum]
MRAMRARRCPATAAHAPAITASRPRRRQGRGRAGPARPRPMAHRTGGKVLRDLRGVLRDREAEIQALHESNYHLRVRQAVLALLARVLEEAAAHKRAHGGGDGGGGGGGGDDEWQQHELMAEAGGAAPHGGAATAPLHDVLPHIAPGASLMGLESIPPDKVEWVQRLDYAAGCEWLKSFIAEGQRALESLAALEPAAADPAGCGSGSDAASAGGAARAALERAGRGILSLAALTMTWRPDLYFKMSARHHISGSDCVGAQDASFKVWDKCISSAGLCREQVLLLLDNNTLLHTRVARIQAQRAAITHRLSLLTTSEPGAAPGPPLCAASSPPSHVGGGGGGAACGPGAAAPPTAAVGGRLPGLYRGRACGVPRGQHGLRKGGHHHARAGQLSCAHRRAARPHFRQRLSVPHKQQGVHGGNAPPPGAGRRERLPLAGPALGHVTMTRAARAASGAPVCWCLRAVGSPSSGAAPAGALPGNARHMVHMLAMNQLIFLLSNLSWIAGALLSGR